MLHLPSYRSLLTFTLALSSLASAYDPSACNNSPSLCAKGYGEITYLGTHNSPFLRDASTSFSSSGNQYFNVTVQLNAGVRLLQAQMHLSTEKGADKGTKEPRMCHGSCDLMDAGTLTEWLDEIGVWMVEHPSEVVTLLIVNADKIPAANLVESFDQSKTTTMAYVPPSGTIRIRSFPTLKEMIAANKRLVVFMTSGIDSAAAPWILDEWNYIWETKWENTDSSLWSCEVDRPASNKGGKASISGLENQGIVPLLNWFLYRKVQLFGILMPDEDQLNKTNADTGPGSLGAGLETCIKSDTWSPLPPPRHPNFILVDFFNVGSPIAIVDKLNNLTSTTKSTTTIMNRIPPPNTPNRNNREANTEGGSDGDGDLSNGGGPNELTRLVKEWKDGRTVSFAEWILAAGGWGVGIKV